MELIRLAKEMRDTPKQGDELGLTEDELAFYDALADHENVKDLMSDKVLAAIAYDLVKAIRSSDTIDWTQKKAVRVNMRRKVKRILFKHGYPPGSPGDRHRAGRGRVSGLGRGGMRPAVSLYHSFTGTAC